MFTFMHKKSIIKAGNSKFQDLINAPRRYEPRHEKTFLRVQVRYKPSSGILICNATKVFILTLVNSYSSQVVLILVNSYSVFGPFEFAPILLNAVTLYFVN